MAIKLSKPANIIRFISIGLFVISLACPCYDTEKEVAEAGEGAMLLLTGFFWFIFISPGFVWLANPLILFSWIYAGKKLGRSFIFSMIALITGSCFLFYQEMLVDESGSNYTTITGHRIGYWLWLASMAIMLFGTLYLQLSAAGSEKSQKISVSA